MHANIGAFSVGWCDYLATGADDSLNQMRDALARSKNAGGTGREPYHYALFADCLSTEGRYDEALLTIEEAFDVIERKREHHWAKAEAHRIMGDVLRSADAAPRETVHRHFQEAQSIAAAQGALTLELRAAVSLAALLSEQGDPEAARATVQAVYDRFTEGFDNPELVHAKSLLH